MKEKQGKPKKGNNLLTFLYIAVILTLSLNVYSYLQISSLNKEISALSAERDGLRNDVTILQSQNKDLNKSLDAANYEKNVLVDQFNGAVKEKTQLLDRIDKLTSQAADLNRQVNDVTAQLKITQGANIGDNSFAENLPRVELFVMSYCPYGTQVEKAILPVVKLLGNKIKFNIRFCSYSMHGKAEVDEELMQYCIQKEEDSKYVNYLTCFLQAGNTTQCLENASIDQELLKSCITETDNTFQVSENYNNMSSWFLQRYPKINLDKDLNDLYGVKASPTLVVNQQVVQSYQRTAPGLLSVICAGFKDQPTECGKSLPPQTPSQGFGYTYTDGSPMGACGG